jgi:hypothetical protein
MGAMACCCIIQQREGEGGRSLLCSSGKAGWGRSMHAIDIHRVFNRGRHEEGTGRLHSHWRDCGFGPRRGRDLRREALEISNTCENRIQEHKP